MGYECFIKQSGIEELVTYELPIGSGKKISINMIKQIGYEAFYIQKGFSPELKREKIIEDCWNMEEVKAACEGYLNAKLNLEEKRKLNVNTYRRGWLKQFQTYPDKMEVRNN